MSEKRFGFKIRLGLDNAETVMSLLNLASFKLTRALELGDITPEHKLTGIEVIDNKDFSYSMMFNFDDEPSVEEIFDRVITGGN